MGQMCMTDADTAQDYFILPALPEGGLPIFQDWLDRMKLVRDRTIPIILPIGKNILVNMVFKISVGYTNLNTRSSTIFSGLMHQGGNTLYEGVSKM